MSASKKPVASPSALMEDAFLDDMLDLSPEDAAAELREGGFDPGEALQRGRRAAVDADADCARRRMADAKAGLAAFRAAPRVVSLGDRQQQRRRLDEMRSRTPSASGMTLAARKAEGLSSRDEGGLLDDLADLERLEREDGEGSPP